MNKNTLEMLENFATMPQYGDGYSEGFVAEHWQYWAAREGHVGRAPVNKVPHQWDEFSEMERRVLNHKSKGYTVAKSAAIIGISQERVRKIREDREKAWRERT